MNDDWDKKDMVTWATEICLLSLVVALWINVFIYFIAEGKGNTVPESETLLNVILGGLVMMYTIRRRYNG